MIDMIDTIATDHSDVSYMYACPSFCSFPAHVVTMICKFHLLLVTTYTGGTIGRAIASGGWTQFVYGCAPRIFEVAIICHSSASLNLSVYAASLFFLTGSPVRLRPTVASSTPQPNIEASFEL